MESFKYKKCNKYNSLLISFIITFFIITAIVIGSLLLFYTKKSNDYLQYLKITEKQTLKLEKSVILQKFNSLYTDLLSLAKQNSLHTFLKNKTDNSKNLINKEFMDFCRLKGIYDQIRFIDKNGMEIFKVNYNKSKSKTVPDDSLESQKDRWFFRNTCDLKDKQIYISPLELFIKNGKIALPLKPVILLGTPVFDKYGKKLGIIIINYLASDIITTIKNYGRLSLGTTILVNSDGYWLLGAKDPTHNWSFMYKDGLNKKFSKEYPSVWKKVGKYPSVQIVTDKGLFTSTTIPLSRLFKETDSNLNTETNILVQNKIVSTAGSEEYFWKLITFIPKKDFISNVNKSLSQYLFRLARLLIILSIIPAFLIAYALTKRKYNRLELYRMANFDKLTKLPNRKHFFETLEHTVRLAIKNKSIFALLYLDIDNFKNINDTLGHEQGDYLLQEAADRFTHSVRETDLVARIGGDEFVIILYNIQSITNAKTVANNILNNFSEPFLLNHEEFQIGVSIGISIFSQKSNNDSILLKQADNAMYKAKHSGKNRFKVFIEKTNK